MTKRSRLEDIGKIAVYLEQALDHEMWDIKPPHSRDKEFAEIFQSQDSEKQHDKLHDLAYNMTSLKDLLCKIMMIAEGDDESELYIG